MNESEEDSDAESLMEGVSVSDGEKVAISVAVRDIDAVGSSEILPVELMLRLWEGSDVGERVALSSSLNDFVMLSSGVSDFVGINRRENVSVLEGSLDGDIVADSESLNDSLAECVSVTDPVFSCVNEGDSVRIRVSVGVGSFDGDSECDLSSLIVRVELGSFEKLAERESGADSVAERVGSSLNVNVGVGIGVAVGVGNTVSVALGSLDGDSVAEMVSLG